MPLRYGAVPRHRQTDLARGHVARGQGQGQGRGAARGLADVEGHGLLRIGGHIDDAAVDLGGGGGDGVDDGAREGGDDAVEVPDGDLDQDRGAWADGDVARTQLHGRWGRATGAARRSPPRPARHGADRAAGERLGPGTVEHGARRGSAAVPVEERTGHHGDLEGRVGLGCRGDKHGREQDQARIPRHRGSSLWMSSDLRSAAERGVPRYTSRWVMRGR